MPGDDAISPVEIVTLQHHVEANERAIELLREYRGQAIAAKDETIATLQVERDTMLIQIEKLREQVPRRQRPWWQFWD